MSAPIRAAYRGNNTGVSGITEQVLAKTGRKVHRYYIVTPMRRRFNIDTLGRSEAFRRALRLRASHEEAVALRMYRQSLAAMATEARP